MVDALLAVIGVGTAMIVAIVAALVYITWKKRKEGRLSPTNYRAFFVMGLIWFVVGSALMAVSMAIGMPIIYAMPLFALGAIYLIIGLLNKDKWRG
jgi:amino acid transporter